MRLEPMELYVLDCFRRRGKVSLRLDEIVAGCTVTRRNALTLALLQLSDDQHLVTRRKARGGDIIELTEEGKHYVALAGDEARDHMERG